MLLDPQSRLVAPIDLVLVAPRVDRLLTDLELVGELADSASAAHKLDDMPTKLGRVSFSTHLFVLVETALESRNRTPGNQGHTSSPCQRVWCPTESVPEREPVKNDPLTNVVESMTARHDSKL